MKLYVFFTLLMVICTLAKAEVTCTIDGKSVKVGQTYQPPGQCRLYKCTNEGTFSTTDCPPVHVTHNCKLIEKDVTKPYPECCARVVCKH
ncbi:venom peptide MmKTx1-like [Stomoxys calcitrans]|uniref:venom peptide MmKTx1-like n=1 Tax=Stomoxys calcitrans TaxID=35570 RepID=UPI0027E31E5C|nr:venom peptide MmKTx1-like [Stomoxys calcitrans]